MNRLGHGVSYSTVLEIETNSKLSSLTTLIPNDIHLLIPSTTVYDNIDRLEETQVDMAQHIKRIKFSKPLSVLLCYQLSDVWKKRKNGTLKFLNVYDRLTMLVENRKFLFFHPLIKNYQQKVFRYN